MHDFEKRMDWSKPPILAVLALGLTTGGALEWMAHQSPTVPEAPVPIEAPEVVTAPEAPGPLEIPEPPAPPPPVEAERDIAAAPTFTPFTIAPSITNREEVIRAMEAAYPPELRELGIGGTVRVYFLIDETGEVQKTLIDQTSGNEDFDAAALSVADIYRFTPAQNREELVPVWVSFPITFQVR